MNPISLALRRPLTVMVICVGLFLISVLALANLLPNQVRVWGMTIPVRSALPIKPMPVDIFPDLNTPVIYVAQPYGGMDPGQMEGFLTNYFEYHFLYITGIHHVESKNIQGVALMKLYFHPGTNMAQAMAETVAYVNRSRSFMPPNTVPPFIMRFDAGSVPVGNLVFSSETKTIGEIQDAALFRVRPMFASLPGVSAPPPFGGNQRTVVVRVNPERLRSYRMSADELVQALASGNQIAPSGSLEIGDKAPMVPINTVVTDIKDLEKIPIRLGVTPTVYLGDVAKVVDSSDIATGYGLVNGKRSVYILVTKRADASTLTVVDNVKANLPKMQAVLPDDIKVDFVFDQSTYVTRALWNVGLEGALGAILTGLMVLLFLRDWRSVIVVVLNIPLALLGAITALWLTGETINLMTLGGLALAVGILVDESTVEVENIHVQMEHNPSVARAVRLGNSETAVPRLLAMLCILAVFIPTFFMQGAAQALFRPLALAVGFAMVTSYLLSSTFVPVLSVWLLRRYHIHPTDRPRFFSFATLRNGYTRLLMGLVWFRWLLLPAYAIVVVLLILGIGRFIGTEIFPSVDAGQFQMRLRAPEGTPLERTEALAQKALEAIGRHVGEDKVEITVTLVGTASYNYPINSIFLWSAGPHEAILRVALKHGSGVRIERLKQELRQLLPALEGMTDVKIAFEAGDIVEDVMSFGSPAKIEVAVSGPKLADNRAFAEKVYQQLAAIPSLTDLQYAQSLDYPTLEIRVDRQKAGLSGVTAIDVGRALAPLTLSSRFTTPLYWRDPASGIGYQIQVQLDQAKLESTQQLGTLPVGKPGEKRVPLSSVADIIEGKQPGEYDRYNMRRVIGVTANIHGEDLGTVAGRIAKAIDAAGARPAGVNVDVRGQIVPMQQMFNGLTVGLVLAVVVILLLLTANFQSIKLALVVVSTVPAVIAGVALALFVTGTTLNIQSFMGAIMAIGVAVANAILLVTFAEKARLAGSDARAAAVDGAAHRLRPILMTSCAMIAGMSPMALALGEGGEQTAPLGRAVIGGLAAATVATLFVLPSVFAVAQGWSRRGSASLDPDDPASTYFERTPTTTNGETVAREGLPVAERAT
jgi:multidrug efflux pump subunit AcrB